MMGGRDRGRMEGIWVRKNEIDDGWGRERVKMDWREKVIMEIVRERYM